MSRVRYQGAAGLFAGLAGSCCYTHAVVADRCNKGTRFSITVRRRRSVHNIIEATPEEYSNPNRHWTEGVADVAETAYTLFGSEPDSVPARLILRGGNPRPASQPERFTSSRYHAFITERVGDTLKREADHRAAPR